MGLVTSNKFTNLSVETMDGINADDFCPSISKMNGKFRI